MEHIPVMMSQVLEGLEIKPDGTYWDGTFGRGGHSREILARLDSGGTLIASDRDEEGELAASALTEENGFRFLRGSLEDVLPLLPLSFSGFLWDLGCSTPQLKDAERGFSFREPGPLDMRMDTSQEMSAADVINDTEEGALADLIYQYGEERFSRRIAARIVEQREIEPITDTLRLAEICRGVYPRRHYYRIDPATRTFQALRIVVNDELGQLERTLPLALERLEPGGRAVVISFHSLEDRIVKHTFKNIAKEGGYKIITKRPLVADETETKANPASRSAKLRIIEKLAADA